MLVRLAPFVFVCLWATGYIGARLGMPHSEPGTFLSIRFAIACALLSAVVLIFRVPWPGLRQAGWAVLIGLLIHGVYLGAVFWAIDRGMPAGVTAVIVGLQPLLTALLAGVWLREPLTPLHWAGLAIGLSGVILVLWPKLQVSGEGITWLTIAAALVGVCSVSLGTVLQKRFGQDISLRSGTALQYLGACLPVFLLAFLFETREVDWNGEMVFAMVWAVIVLSVGAVFLLMWLIRRDSVSRISSVFYLVPAVTAMMGYVLFGEHLEPVQLAGMGLCALSVSLASKTAKQG